MIYLTLENRGFIQRIKFEDKVLEQIGRCNDVFGEGDRRIIDNSVGALENLLYAIPDPKGMENYKDELELLEQTYKKRYETKMVDYRKRCSVAQCPDVINKPSKKIPLDILGLKYREILNILAVNGLTLTSKNLTHL